MNNNTIDVGETGFVDIYKNKALNGHFVFHKQITAPKIDLAIDKAILEAKQMPENNVAIRVQRPTRLVWHVAIYRRYDSLKVAESIAEHLGGEQRPTHVISKT